MKQSKVVLHYLLRTIDTNEADGKKFVGSTAIFVPPILHPIKFKSEKTDFPLFFPKNNRLANAETISPYLF